MSAGTQRLLASTTAEAAAPAPGRRWVVAVWAASRALVGLTALVAAALPGGPAAHARGVSSGLQLWDGWWYLQVARHWYDPAIAHGQTAAFSPGFPALWRVLMALPGPPALVAGIANSLILLPALWIVFLLTERVLDTRRARLTVLVMALFPVSFVYSLPYAESLYLLLAAGSLLLLHRRRDGGGAVVAALACAVRPTGVTLVPALAAALVRRAGRRRLALAAIPLLAAAVVVIAIGLRAGDLLAQFHAQREGWARGAGFPPLVIWRYLDANLVHFRHPLRALLDTAFAALWIVLAVRLWRMHTPIEYPLFAICAVAMPLLGGSALSLGRFGMVAFPLSWALADWAGASGRRLRLVTAAMTAGLVGLELAALYASAYVP